MLFSAARRSFGSLPPSSWASDSVIYSPPALTKEWKAKKELHISWKKGQRFLRDKVDSSAQVPEKFATYDKEFDNVLTFESQLDSLQSRGFLRAFKAYDPPEDVDRRFMEVATEELV